MCTNSTAAPCWRHMRVCSYGARKRTGLGVDILELTIVGRDLLQVVSQFGTFRTVDLIVANGAGISQLIWKIGARRYAEIAWHRLNKFPALCIDYIIRATDQR